MNSQLISIIIPTFDRGSIIAKTLDSVIGQKYKFWECIVIDDGSSDHTETVVSDILTEHKNITYFRRDSLPKGVSTCRNIGIKKASGDFIIFLDSDDLLDKNCLENRIKYAVQYKENDFWVFKMQEFINEVGDVEKIHNKYPEVELPEEYLKLFLQGINPFSVTSPLWRKKSLVRLNGFNEELELWEDPELHIRSILKGLKFNVNIEAKPDCYYRNNREAKKGLDENLQYLERLFEQTWKYYNVVAHQLNIKNDKKIEHKNLLLFNMINFIKKYIIEKKNSKQFIRYYFLLIKHGLLNLKQCIILIAWFLFMFLQIKKLGRWSVNSLRKRMYYLISNS